MLPTRLTSSYNKAAVSSKAQSAGSDCQPLAGYSPDFQQPGHSVLNSTSYHSPVLTADAFSCERHSHTRCQLKHDAFPGRASFLTYDGFSRRAASLMQDDFADVTDLCQTKLASTHDFLLITAKGISTTERFPEFVGSSFTIPFSPDSHYEGATYFSPV